MGEVDSPAPFRVSGRPPPDVLEVGRERGRDGCRERARRKGRADLFPRDRLRLRDPAHRVGERRVVGVSERERDRPHLHGHDLGRIERGERRSRPRKQIAGEGVRIRGCRRHRRDVPCRPAAEVVREPRREDRRALVVEIDAPARLRFGRRRPPQALEVAEYGWRRHHRPRLPGEVGGDIRNLLPVAVDRSRAVGRQRRVAESVGVGVIERARPGRQEAVGYDVIGRHDAKRCEPLGGDKDPPVVRRAARQVVRERVGIVDASAARLECAIHQELLAVLTERFVQHDELHGPVAIGEDLLDSEQVECSLGGRSEYQRGDQGETRGTESEDSSGGVHDRSPRHCHLVFAMRHRATPTPPSTATTAGIFRHTGERFTGRHLAAWRGQRRTRLLAATRRDESDLAAGIRVARPYNRPAIVAGLATAKSPSRRIHKSKSDRLLARRMSVASPKR